MTPRTDLTTLIKARQRYGADSWTYRMLLVGLAETVAAVGIERFLDDIVGSAK